MEQIDYESEGVADMVKSRKVGRIEGPGLLSGVHSLIIIYYG